MSRLSWSAWRNRGAVGVTALVFLLWCLSTGMKSKTADRADQKTTDATFASSSVVLVAGVTEDETTSEADDPPAELDITEELSPALSVQQRALRLSIAELEARLDAAHETNEAKRVELQQREAKAAALRKKLFESQEPISQGDRE